MTVQSAKNKKLFQSKIISDEKIGKTCVMYEINKNTQTAIQIYNSTSRLP